MIKQLFSAAVLLLAGCAASYECSMSKGELAPGVPEYTFNNGLLEIKVVSGVSGIVNSMEYLPGKLHLFEPMKYSEKTHDLLPSQVHVTVTGGRELIWGLKNFINTPMKLLDLSTTPEKNRISMSSRFFQGENIEAHKTVELAAGTLAVDVTFTITNRGRKPQQMSLWKHLSAQLTPEQRDLIILPARGGVDRVAGRAVLPMESDVVYHDFEPEHQSFFIAPLAPWVARSSSDGVNRGTLVMTSPGMSDPQARFYTWKHSVKILHTAEMILPPQELAPGGSKKYEVRYFYFPHLKALRALDDATGFDIVPGALVIEHAVPKAAQEYKIYCRGTLIGTYTVPALPAGKAYKIKLDKKYTGKDVSLDIVTQNNKKINLPKIKESAKNEKM